MLRRIVISPWFALADLFLVILSGLLWVFKSEIGILVIVSAALIPWAVRLLASQMPFKKTRFDWLVAFFLVTAWVGYWAAYDREAAWSKVWLIVLSVLLFYALSSQPTENLVWVCTLLFCIGLGVSVYFFLTQDFVTFPRKIELVNRLGHWLMERIPRLGWTPIHPNYVAGIATITTPFILYPARKLVKRSNLYSTILFILIVGGLGVALVAILMATSRGIVMAIASATGLWIVWRIVDLNRSRLQLRSDAVFPSLVLICLFAVILILYAGPANLGYFSSDHYYGTGSRGELFARSVYLLLDFPFIGGGLAAFPGLYSHYMLGIPNFNILNSHNLFLDVAIEQGLLGGLVFLIIFLLSIWYTAKTIAQTVSSGARILGWVTFFALVIAFIHGMVDDYLYNGIGTLLLLSLAGLSMLVQPEIANKVHPTNRWVSSFVALALIGFFMINLNGVRSAWNANLGAVQMAKVELAGFPTNQWIDSSILPELEQADASLRSALQADPMNLTANHRSGLIAMLREDFPLAVTYLERANQEAPNHRGIIKSLGYCYVWLGNMEKAQLFLGKIPEARAELDVYVWWWGVQGRTDLADKAALMYSRLESISS